VTPVCRLYHLAANVGENHQSLRIGNSKMTVQEFEARTLRLQQQSTDEACDRGKVLIAIGQLLLRNGDYVLTLGAYVATQHGPKSPVINNALDGKDVAGMTDRQIIEAIYAQRAAVVVNRRGKSVAKYFPGSRPNKQASVADRFAS
jgi:hypothetical protein